MSGARAFDILPLPVPTINLLPMAVRYAHSRRSVSLIGTSPEDTETVVAYPKSTQRPVAPPRRLPTQQRQRRDCSTF